MTLEWTKEAKEKAKRLGVIKRIKDNVELNEMLGTDMETTTEKYDFYLRGNKVAVRKHRKRRLMKLIDGKWSEWKVE